MEFSGSELIFSYIADPFGFAVKRRSNGQVLFNSSSEGSDPFGDMVFKDQYLEISTRLPKDASLYGLGENTQPHGIKLYPNDPYTLYTTDIAAVNLNADLYGSHPVYMDLRNVGGVPYAHAVLLLNSNGMDVFYRGTSLTYKIIGGVFDLYFFSGPSPLDVVQQYTALIGRPAPMPYWSFGFHQCRWGYHNLSVVEDVVANYQKYEIPLDVIWNDDDHMDGHKDFTLNPNNYPRPKLLAFLDKIHKMGMKYIVIIDPGISVNSSYGVHQRGMAKDVFIKYHGEPYLAQVWPGALNFPDYLNPKAVDWWVDEIRRFHELVPVDGLWIDMNEASNFCTGLCTLPKGKQCPTGSGPGWICCLECKNVTATRWDDPPYKINASGLHVPIGFKTIATSAVHYNGVLEYDAHSLYGFAQSVATHKGLLALEGKRPFILSRSTFVGSGKYTAHWTGDNQGTWENLKYSISTMLNFGIFGVPMVGSDICGFYPQPTEELCNRWIELGAFYPFSRDHANFYSPRQELYQWKSVAKSAKNALGMRYKLLPYLYTLSYEAHISGAPIARPLFFSFPNYTKCYNISTQFLLGSSVMVSPVLDKGKSEVKALFPPGTWYSLFDMSQTIVTKEPHYLSLDAPLHVVNVHVYQNTILPMQQGGLISKEARKTPFTQHLTPNPMAHRLLLLLFLLFTASNALNNTTLNTNLTSLRSFCESTPYPDSCFRSLKLSIGINIDPNILSHLLATLATAISESLKLSDLLSAAGNNLNIVEKQRGSVQDCRDLHQITVNALSRSVTKVNAGGSKNLADAGAYLSAALTNKNTCLEGLESASGPMKPTVIKSVVGTYEHVSNSLSILRRQISGAGRRSRRLMGFQAWVPRRARRILDDYGDYDASAAITVAGDGTGNFTTISDAVRFAPSNSYDRIIVFVREGVYEENVEIPSDKTNIVLLGDGSDVTVVTGSRSVAGGWTTFRSATVAVSGDGFLARDMTFENTAGPESGQAVALRINADLTALYRCAVTGYQDTLYAHSFRQFYRECDISGTVDYIFGNAATVFQASNIISRLPMKGQYTVITAQSRETADESTGFSLQNCSILATDDLYSNRTAVRSYLGRPWRAFSRTVVLESYIDDFIDPSGWREWSGSEELETLYYGEYENYGPGSGTENRVGWGGYHVMDYYDAYNFTVSEFITGDAWLDSTSFPYDDGV